MHSRSLFLLLLLMILSTFPVFAQETMVVTADESAPAFACAEEDCQRLAWLPPGAGVTIIAAVEGRELDGSARWYEVSLDCPCFNFERHSLEDLPDTKDPEENTWSQWHPYWAPDNARIATVVLNSLYVWDAEGGERLVQTPLDVPNPSHMSWAPDGTRIVLGGGFWLDDEEPVRMEPEHNLQLIDADGNSPVLLIGQAGKVYDVVWSHDGTRLVAVGDELRIWDVQSGKTLLALEESATGVAWSPDDRRIAVVEQSGVQEVSRLRLRDATSGDLLTSYEDDKNSYIADMTWEPEGGRVAFITHYLVAREDDNDLITGSALYLWDGVGHNAPALLFETADWLSDIDWSPDGRFLVALVRGGVLVLAASDGQTVTTLIPPLASHFQEWKSDRFLMEQVDWSPDGLRIAATGISLGDRMGTIQSAALVWDLTLIPEGPVRAFIHSGQLGSA